jgi:HAE1 family hydrophobic/amphiphilic exporter-1
MPLPSTSIKRPVTAAMFYIAVALIGIYAFSRIGVDLLPNINIPHLLVQTTYPNASPEEIEKLITEPLESSARTVTGIKNITSVSKEGISVISVNFIWGTNMDFALLSLREKLDNVRFILPREAGRPTIIRVDPSATPIMTLSLSPSPSPKERGAEHSPINKIQFVSESSPESDIRKLIDLKEAARVIFKRRLEQIDGVAQAIITGGLEREILVEVDLQRLAVYNLTFSEIATALKSSNVNLPAGSIMKGLFRYSLRTIGEFQNTDEIGKTIIKRNTDGSVIYLKDIASLKESFKEREGLTRFNGSETVGLLINKEPESNTVDIAARVREAVSLMQKEYPEYTIQIVSDYSKFIVNAIQNVKQEIYYGGILAFLVLFFFLASIRSILIIGITIPASLFLTILLMYLFNISFNIVSLGGIAVGIGMLLDNSIIVIENVTRYKEMGLSLRESALRGSNEVAMPVVAATLTTIAVFLPLIFMKGITGELFKDQSYAVVFSLAASIITALTLIPMLASRERFRIFDGRWKMADEKYLYFKFPVGRGILSKIFFWIRFPFVFIFKSLLFIAIVIFEKANKPIKLFFKRFFERVNVFMELIIAKYDKLLLWSLNNRKKVLLLMLGLILLTIFAIIDIKKEFIPEAPEDEFVVELTYPKGTSLEGNSINTSEIENAILKIDGVTDVVSNIGRVNEFDFLNREQISIDKTNLIVKLDSYNKFYQVRERVQTLLKNAKGINHTFRHIETAFSQVINPSKNDIAIVIKNKDIDKAFEKGNLLLKKIKEQNIEGIADLRLGIEKGEPEYKITIDREKCLAYGINLTDASNQIVNLVKGNEATLFSDFDKKIAIRLKALESQRDDISKILESEIIVNKIKIPVKNLVNYELTESYNEIWREDQSRTIYIYARLADVGVDKIIPQLEKIANIIPKNAGEMINISGLNQEIKDSFGGLYIALIIAVLLMYMVLAAEFESFLFPFVIILSVPMGLIGSILLLYVLGESINIISVMGLIILVGIADNDAVVKVEFILRKRKEGLPLQQAILEAGRDRFRPIVMNSFTVIFALIPMIIGIGAATQLRVSLSIALAGGLISATFLTLIIIPVLYTYMERYSKKNFDGV